MAILNEEMRQQAIGVESVPFSIEIEKGMLRRFAEAVENLNSRWLGGSMEVPPGMFHTLMLVGPRPELPFQLPVSRILDGGGEWEYFVTSRPGDVLTVVTKIVDLYERDSGSSSMVFFVRETTWKNQRRELVARARSTTIIR